MRPLIPLSWNGVRCTPTQLCCSLRLVSACTTATRHFSIPPIEKLTHAGSTEPARLFTGSFATSSTNHGQPLMSSAYVLQKGTDVPTLHRQPRNAKSADEAAEKRAEADENDGFHFAVKDSERGQLEHGVSPEALDFIAEAEAQYRASSAHLHDVPGGPGMPETYESVDEATGMRRITTRVASPFGETFVPSSRDRNAVRGSVGELAYQEAARGKFLLDERAQLNLKKERQLDELLGSPMPLLEKAEEVTLMLKESFYPQGLALQPRVAETVMQLLGQASLQLRLRGEARGQPQALLEAGGAALPSVPFLDDMRLLYGKQKASFAAPTPLTVEHLMTACSAVTEANQANFQFANRLLLDCDKYVVLPSRTTYAAYFTVCRVNAAVVPFAVARLKDAVVGLHVSLDAPMATELLKGLNEGGYVEEAVALLARVEKVPMTTPLLNASLETLLLSRQATSCFSAYASVKPAALKPNADTYTLLLLACEQSGEWGRVTRILSDMQRRRVRGNTQTLNLLLKGLLMEKLPAYALQLYDTMKNKKVAVWPALEKGLEGIQRKRDLQQLTDRKAFRDRESQHSRRQHEKH